METKIEKMMACLMETKERWKNDGNQIEKMMETKESLWAILKIWN